MLSTTLCLIGLAATVVCWRSWRRLRRCTLGAPAAWATVSLAAVTCHASWLAYTPDEAGSGAAAHLAYLAGITTLAPFVALLGAKRPQHRAWQFIVASLLALLALQDLRSWIIDSSMPPAPHAAWRWLVAALAIMQFLNYLPTRYAAAACLGLAGQICLLWRQLPLAPAGAAGAFQSGLGLLGAAVLLAALLARGRARAGDGWQRAWLDFRDQYGTLWALRVAERANAMAMQQNCSVRLGWDGFRPLQDAIGSAVKAGTPDEAEPMHQALRAILARFVSAEWLADRGDLSKAQHQQA